ncbi:hypothetical protein QN277_000227 [Acacia crassicarpa]|uniref:Uncharacterized protein n=1 Tax=Acacia crassicarpa TaxID=499986 RepID=A0AAE1N4W8_9FABA|nr:hypothetical protein QN277_000227 [Acacia crassicarpa]
MNGKTEITTDFWVGEFNGKAYTPTRLKRKVRSKKKEYIGWGSTLLISFLESLGKDTSEPLTQYDVTAIVNEYIVRNNLIHPQKKKRIVCDERLHSLFGRKSIGRVKVYELLESHFAANCDESSDDPLLNSEDDENNLATCESPKKRTPASKTLSKKRVSKKPKSCFAAIIPANIKLLYLRKSLAQDLLKDPETFESKLVGSFIRIRCDPNDYLQKNSHQLLLVTGIKKRPGMKDGSGEIVLQVSGFFKDVGIHMLSDDDFTEEECNDLCQRVKGGLLERPTIVDFEQKARTLHKDMTKHWLARELAMLKNLIERANEKGWRSTLDEYLQRKAKLQNPDEQARLLQEIPSVISDDIESESAEPDFPEEKMENDSPELLKTTFNTSLPTGVQKEVRDTPNSESAPPDVSEEKMEHDSPELLQTTYEWASLPAGVEKEVRDAPEPENTTMDIADCVKHEKNSPKSILRGSSEVPSDMSASGTAYSHDPVSAENCNGIHGQQIDLTCEDDDVAEPEKAKVSQQTPNKPIPPSEVIELSDDDEETKEPSSAKQTTAMLLDMSIGWHYRDPQGSVQGPFSVHLLKHWSDANYFSPDFKVWKAGQSPDECVLLVDVLHWFFAR